MKDSLAYRGTVLWNTICLNENGISHLREEKRGMYLPEFSDEADEMNSISYKPLTRTALAEKGPIENRDH